MLPAPLDTSVRNTQHRGNPASNSNLKLSQALKVVNNLGIYAEGSRIPHQCGACSGSPRSSAFHMAPRAVQQISQGIDVGVVGTQLCDNEYHQCLLTDLISGSGWGFLSDC